MKAVTAGCKRPVEVIKDDDDTKSSAAKRQRIDPPPVAASQPQPQPPQKPTRFQSAKSLAADIMAAVTLAKYGGRGVIAPKATETTILALLAHARGRARSDDLSKVLLGVGWVRKGDRVLHRANGGKLTELCVAALHTTTVSDSHGTHYPVSELSVPDSRLLDVLARLRPVKGL